MMTFLPARTLNQLISTLSAAILSATASVAGAAQPTSTPCFSTNQWDGWTAPKPDVLLIGVNRHDVFRAELSGPSASLKRPGSFLVNKVRGSNRVCSGLDLDLEVSDDLGFSEPLIVKSLTRLTPEEAAALPKKDDPR